MRIFSWWTNRKRRRVIANPTPAAWMDWLHQLWFFSDLGRHQQTAIVDSVKVLVAEKNWEGCGGLTMTDEIRVTIAGQIGWLVAGIGPEYFDQVQSILVYPDAYVAPGQQTNHGGVVLEGDSSRQGEAWYRGPVILSWDDAREGGLSPNRGHNLVLHEFAHQLDMLNGRDVDGVPPIENFDDAENWQRVIHREFGSLSDACRQGYPTLLDCYGTTNLAEFFAVVTETFFQHPDALANHHHELYQVLAKYYHQIDLARSSKSKA